VINTDCARNLAVAAVRVVAQFSLDQLPLAGGVELRFVLSLVQRFQHLLSFQSFWS
jgi:hypothetical protein